MKKLEKPRTDCDMLFAMNAMAILSGMCVLLLMPIGAMAGGGPDDTRVPFETIMQGSHADRREAGEEVARSQSEYERIWRQTQSGRATEPDVEGGATEVDFDDEMVIALFMGQQSTGGYAIEVDEVRVDEQTATVYYRERRPGPDEIVTQALTSPYHLVRLPRLSQEVRFSRRD